LAVLITIVIVLWALSGLGLVVFIMMHSGKGTGLNEMIASSFYNTGGGSAIVEKNLDRLTVICAIIFFACILAMMVIYPEGSVAK
jgi:preprotein translocase subunit SecG